ncbi:MAG TPA: cation:proton antiporter, partial [Deinococcales bacterium]|nr:cation:proton antiporter [Deinococcales bacterium]
PLHPDETPAERLVEREVSPEALAHPAVASGVVLRDVLTFGETLERLLGVLVVVLTGVLASRHFSVAVLPVTAVLLFAIRPAAALLSLAASPVGRGPRALMGWLGIRGIGSLYYLAYAVGEGIGPERAAVLSDVVVTTVAVSIFLHGTSVTPLVTRYERALERRSARPDDGVTLPR